MTRLIHGRHVVIAARPTAFLSLSAGHVLAFLVGMERYERRPVTPWYTYLSPDQLYRRITDEEGADMTDRTDRGPEEHAREGAA